MVETGLQDQTVPDSRNVEKKGKEAKDLLYTSDCRECVCLCGLVLDPDSRPTSYDC